MAKNRALLARSLAGSLLSAAMLAAVPGHASPLYNGGPVISATPDVYFIWYGNWSPSDTALSLLPTFVQTLNGSSYLATETSMAGDGLVNYSGSGFISSSSALYLGGLNNPSSQISLIVQNSIKANLVPYDPLGIYDVLTAPGLFVNGFNTKFCGFHGSTDWGKAALGTQYGFIGDPTASQTGCYAQSNSPNGNLGADAMVSVIAHELIETVTDPTGTAWWDSKRRSSTYGEEDADMCAWNFGTLSSTSSGAKYNYTSSAGTNYLLQQEWVNTGGGLGYNGGYCSMAYSGASTASSINGPSGANTANFSVAMPEPLTLSLFGAGLTGAIAMRRRKSKT